MRPWPKDSRKSVHRPRANERFCNLPVVKVQPSSLCDGLTMVLEVLPVS